MSSSANFSFFLALAGTLGAQLVVNSAEPVTKSFLVQIVDTAADDGSAAAPLFGTSSQQAAIFSDVDRSGASRDQGELRAFPGNLGQRLRTRGYHRRKRSAAGR